MQKKYAKVISLNLTLAPYQDFVTILVRNAQERQSAYVCVANVHMCIEAHDNPDFALLVNDADFVTPDGMPLVKGLKLLYGIKQDRVAGMDLLPDLLKTSEQNGLKVLFYGGTQEMQNATREYVSRVYPSLRTVGFHSPPFRQLSQEEECKIIQDINSSEANFVFVALGCPKQEKWMASMKGKVNACMVGIGGALPVMIGAQKRAPHWMQTNSLEWLYRLFQEPRRLFWRYAYTNTKFIYLLVREKMKQNKMLG